MHKIGTHDSITGEKSIWWSYPLIPFARTQRKTLTEQFFAGCRLFDIRLKYVCGKWRGAHGWWFTKESADVLLNRLFSLASFTGEDIHILLTYEGKAKNAKKFLEYVDSKLICCMKNRYVHFGPISAKYKDDGKGIIVDYEILRKGEENWIDTTKPNEQCFKVLDGKTWHTYIPIPFLWKQFFFKKVEFNSENYKFVDFL